eukprot:8809700-Pyramimonas_sp.AAC.1
MSVRPKRGVHLAECHADIYKGYLKSDEQNLRKGGLCGTGRATRGLERRAWRASEWREKLG